jgi:hypothetical protein
MAMDFGESIDALTDQELLTEALGAVITIIAVWNDNEDMALLYPIAKEVDAQAELIDNRNFKSAVIRQSTFFEYLITRLVIKELEDQSGGDLTNSQQHAIDNMRHQQRIELAHLLGIITAEERDPLLEMAKTRNKVAHNWWILMDESEEEVIEKVARNIHGLIYSNIEEQLSSIE